MAFPTNSTVIDDFNRASIGANWSLFETGAAIPEIISSTVVGSTGGAYKNGYYNVTTYGPDSEAYIDITTKGSSAQACWLGVRGTTPGSSSTVYEFEIKAQVGTDTWTIYDGKSGTYTSRATGSQEFAAGEKFGVDAITSGSDVIVTGYRYASGAWASLGTWTDTPATSPITAAGYIVYGQDQAWRCDNLSGGTIVTAATAIPLVMPPPIPA